MYSDLDYNHPEVQNDVVNWGTWLGKETGIKGIRFDAIKHASKDIQVLILLSYCPVFGGFSQAICGILGYELRHRMVLGWRSQSSRFSSIAVY